MVQLRFTRRFSMAHRLYSGRSGNCFTPHGHNEFVHVTLSQKADAALPVGWGDANCVAPFAALKGPWHAFVDQALDHAFQLSASDPLVDYFRQHEPDVVSRLLIVPGDPTTEAVGLALLSKLQAFLAKHSPAFECVRFELEETPTNAVILTPEDLRACPIDLGPWTRRADFSINDLLPPSAFGSAA